MQVFSKRTSIKVMLERNRGKIKFNIESNQHYIDDNLSMLSLLTLILYLTYYAFQLWVGL